MSVPLKIGVLGAGSIGCYVAGKLLAADAAELVLVGRPKVQAELRAHGLSVKDFEDPPQRTGPDRLRIEVEASALAEVAVVLVAVKSAQSEEAGRALAAVIPEETLVVSLQNGMHNAERLRSALPGRTVLQGIVGFNVVSVGGGLFHRAMSGPLFLERSSHAWAAPLSQALLAAQLELLLRDDIKPDQWTKLLINLNNAVSALSGAPTVALLKSPGYRRIVAAVIEEALQVLAAVGVRPAKLRGVPIGLMPKVLRLPTWLVRLVTRAQMRVNPEARSSMWEDLQKGRPTEVEDLNGEIVRLAAQLGTEAPLNRRIVALVHRAERAGPGAPEQSAEALWTALSGDEGPAVR